VVPALRWVDSLVAARRRTARSGLPTRPPGAQGDRPPRAAVQVHTAPPPTPLPITGITTGGWVGAEEVPAPVRVVAEALARTPPWETALWGPCQSDFQVRGGPEVADLMG